MKYAVCGIICKNIDILVLIYEGLGILFLLIAIKYIKNNYICIESLSLLRFCRYIGSIFSKKVPVYCMIGLITLILFYSFDIYLRSIVYESVSFFSIGSFTPNIVTFSSYLILISLFLFCPKIISRIVCVVVFLLSYILFLADYMLYMVKNSVFSLYDIGNAKEGLTYINFIFKHFNIKLVLFLIMSIILLVCLYYFIGKRKKSNKSLVLASFTISIVISSALITCGIEDLEDYETTDWNQVQYPKYYYDNFINSNRSLSVLGFYGYHIRDAYLYYKSFTEAFGSSEEIESLLDSFGSSSENEMTGIFEGKNLIMIQMESIDKLVVTPEIMPALYYMKSNGWDFSGRYTDNLSTLASEFVFTTGLYQVGNYYNINKNNYSESIPSLFNRNGYRTASIHQNYGYYYNRTNLHNAFGYSNSYFLLDLYHDLPAHDDRIMVTNDDIYNSIVSKEYEPFMSLIITVSAHGPYNNCNSTERECLNFLSNQTDQMLGALLKRLDNDELLNNTVLLLYSDHYPYSYSYSEEEYNIYSKFSKKYKIMDLPFIIFSTDIQPQKIETMISDVDVVPTVLNLFGIPFDSRRYVGVDIFSPEHLSLCYYPDYRWYDGKIYNFSDEVKADDEYFNNISDYVKRKIDLNKMIVSNNYYQK